MKYKTIAGLVMLSFAGFSLPAHSADNAALTDPSVKIVAPAALTEGENSFTEDQARKRFEEAGYSNLSALTLDTRGIWRATGSKDAKDHKLGLDFKGNIAVE